jgi:RHS repeat-associated protein
MKSTGSFNNNIGGFDKSGITYDANRNILTLVRNKSVQGANSHAQIDNLVYAYNTTVNPNQLLKVTDGTDTVHTNSGFRNLTGSTGSYSYDGTNGNLAADPYKGLALSYDVLNRTDKEVVTTGTGQYINYTYNASGAILRKQQYNGGSLITTTDYIDGFVYLTAGAGSAALSYFPMPEGRVVVSGSTYTQQFIITDQQGNARIAFQNNGSGTAVVTQENSYYGLGLIMPNSPVSTPAVPNKQLYNGGSEWQNDYSNLPDYYQTNNRNYDAAIGRFIGVDPMAESAESMSSYQYAGNNPVMYNDPMGNAWSPIYHPLGDGDGIAESGALNFGGVDDSDGGGGGGGSHSNSNGNSSSNVSGSNVSSSNGATAADGPPTDTNVAINSPSTTPVNFNGVNALQEVVVSATSLAQSSNAPSINFNGMNMLAEVQIVGQGNASQGGPNVSLISGPFNLYPRDYLDAKFSVSGVQASNLQYIQVVHYPGHDMLDGGGYGKPYYYTPYQMRAKTFVNWNGNSGTIELQDLTNAYQVLTWVTFESLIVAVNYNNTGYDKVLADFTWGFTGQSLNSQTINLNPTASPQALQIIKSMYPDYKIK